MIRYYVLDADKMVNVDTSRIEKICHDGVDNLGSSKALFPEYAGTDLKFVSAIFEKRAESVTKGQVVFGAGIYKITKDGSIDLRFANEKSKDSIEKVYWDFDGGELPKSEQRRRVDYNRRHNWKPTDEMLKQIVDLINKEKAEALKENQDQLRKSKN